VPLRALFAIPELDRAGPEAVFFRLISNLDRDRIVPEIAVTRPDGHYLELLRERVPVHVVGDPGDRYPFRALARTVRDVQPDFVLSTLRMSLTAGGVAWRFPRSTKLVVRQANHVSSSVQDSAVGQPLKRFAVDRFYRNSFRQADLVVCQSRSMAEDFDAAGLSGPRVVLSNPIDIAAIQAAAAQPRALAGSPRLLSVGRLFEQKGFDLLLQALPSVLAEHPGAHLTIVGEGPQRPELERLVSELDLGDHVTLAGFQNDPAAWMAGTDLMVSSSRYEGFANTTLEALALGRPVVGTSGPGANDEMLVDGFNGFTVPPLDPAALAAGISKGLAALPGFDRAAMVADVEARFGVASIVEQYTQVLEDVCGSPRA
jgi:glycosyltransferase involved in cell wall biosynthesis